MSDAEGFSREFLEEVWSIARKQLPGWVFSTLHSEARSRSGGRARHRIDEPTVVEKLALTALKPEALAKATVQELGEVWARLQQWFLNASRRRQPVEAFVNAGLWVLDELKTRGVELGGCPLKDAVDQLRKGPPGQQVAKAAPGVPQPRTVPTQGPQNAPVAFVGASPGRFELARKEQLVGSAGVVFNEQYLKPLGLKRAEVVLTNVVPALLEDAEGKVREPTDQEAAGHRQALLDELRELNPRLVVALGKTAQAALGDAADFMLPHPAAVHRYGDRGEVSRKLRRIQAALAESVHKQMPRGMDEGGEGTQGEAATADWAAHWQDYLPKSGRGRFVYQHHWRGLPEDMTGKTDAELLQTDHSVHGDLRLEGEGGLWGWAVLIGRAADNKTAGGDKLFAAKPGDKLELAIKPHNPKEWLDVGVGKPYLVEPGGPGATSGTYAKFFAVDHGTYQLGVASQDAIEVFLDGSRLKGRYLLQLAEFEDGRRVWLIDKPADQTPIAERRDLADAIGELKQKRQRFLIWTKPGEKPRLIDVETAPVAKASLEVPIAKADPEKRIVYGVVLDPYGERGPEEDAHDDWMPPSEIERTAHQYMGTDRVVGLQHEKKANARVVESWVEQYPTREDYLAAMALQPHKVVERPFGTDKVHSGSWCMGVELGPKEWELFKNGTINAFSPGGMGVRTPISRSVMPKVTLIELVPKQV